jgi:hypothetical protein
LTPLAVASIWRAAHANSSSSSSESNSTQWQSAVLPDSLCSWVFESEAGFSHSLKWYAVLYLSNYSSCFPAAASVCNAWAERHDDDDAIPGQRGMHPLTLNSQAPHCNNTCCSRFTASIRWIQPD